MNAPDAWEAVLLGLAAWRTFQLIAFDEILDRPRRWVLRLGDWHEGDPVEDFPKEEYRLSAARFMTCPYCLGAWIAGSWWLAFQCSERWSLIFASLFALAVVPIAGHKLLARDEDK